MDLVFADGDGIEVLKAMADVKFAGSVIIISATPAARRIAARSYARSLGIELQSLPKPVDLAALRICLANLCKTAMDPPHALTSCYPAENARRSREPRCRRSMPHLP
jgi:two-component system chemotaxis response regulator CheY